MKNKILNQLHANSHKMTLSDVIEVIAECRSEVLRKSFRGEMNSHHVNALHRMHMQFPEIAEALEQHKKRKSTALETWQEKYKPVNNPLTRGNAYGNTFFESHGKEAAYVRKHAAKHPNTVWTYLTGDGDVIQSGIHTVNRYGYFITEVPYEEGDTITVNLEK
jgi:hypothetical protein